MGSKQQLQQKKPLPCWDRSFPILRHQERCTCFILFISYSLRSPELGPLSHHTPPEPSKAMRLAGAAGWSRSSHTGCRFQSKSSPKRSWGRFRPAQDQLGTSTAAFLRTGEPPGGSGSTEVFQCPAFLPCEQELPCHPNPCHGDQQLSWALQGLSKSPHPENK